MIPTDPRSRGCSLLFLSSISSVELRRCIPCLFQNWRKIPLNYAGNVCGSFERPWNFTVRHPQQLPLMHVNPPIEIPNGFSPNLAKAVVASSDAWTFFSACTSNKMPIKCLWMDFLRWKQTNFNEENFNQRSVVDTIQFNKIYKNEVLNLKLFTVWDPNASHLQYLSFNFFLHQVLDHTPKAKPNGVRDLKNIGVSRDRELSVPGSSI